MDMERLRSQSLDPRFGIKPEKYFLGISEQLCKKLRCLDRGTMWVVVKRVAGRAEYLGRTSVQHLGLLLLANMSWLCRRSGWLITLDH
jgi:hypothetical protein